MTRKRICILCGRMKFLFSFPEEESARQLWLKSVGLPSNYTITTKDKICSRHFAPNQFRNNNLRRLKTDVCPSDLVYEHCDTETEELNKTYKNQCMICGFISGSGFFRFPSNVDIRQQWAEFCDLRLDTIKPHYRLCDKHFEPEDYRILNNRKFLIRASVPTLLPKVKQNSFSINNSESSITTVSSPTFDVNALENVICSPDVQSNTAIKAPRKPYFRFFGDIKEDDVVTSAEAAKLALKMGKQEVEKCRQKIRCLNAENFKLKTRCSRLEDTVADLKKRIKQFDDKYFG